MSLSPSSIIWYWPRGSGSSAGKVTAGLAESNGQTTGGFMTKVTCGLTAKQCDFRFDLFFSFSFSSPVIF